MMRTYSDTQSSMNTICISARRLFAFLSNSTSLSVIELCSGLACSTRTYRSIRHNHHRANGATAALNPVVPLPSWRRRHSISKTLPCNANSASLLLLQPRLGLQASQAESLWKEYPQSLQPVCPTWVQLASRDELCNTVMSSTPALCTLLAS